MTKLEIKDKLEVLVKILAAGFKLVQAPYKSKNPVMPEWPKNGL